MASMMATTATAPTKRMPVMMTTVSSSSQPLVDENNNYSKSLDAAATTVAASASGMKKIPVPSSDRRLVLSAIDNQINLAKDAWGEKTFNSDQNQQQYSNEAAASRGEFFMNCINQTGASLHQQLELVTTPVADDDDEGGGVESMLDSFRTRLATATLRSNITSDQHCDGEEDSLSSSSLDDDEEFEFDDAKIVDAEAYHQVKQLRAQARDIALRVMSIRDETVGRAMEMTQRNLVELMRVHGFDNDHHSPEEEEQNANGDKEMSSDTGNDTLNPLRMAIQTLASSLKHVDSNLGDNLESLKETIGTIDSSVEKIQRHLKGDESALSRMEKALLAASGGNPEEDTTAVVVGGGVEFADESTTAEETESVSVMNPDKKLAHLLAGIL
ncbi:hypothetical protein ACHAXH_000842 [Discostella pseudostelligera]